ncbi:MAG: phosphatase PAP2 family protein [Peptostreptococcaceae bacterium]|nr:phosphatase PAP2 family protein [Peptostreptococcaceae bacterium]MDY5738512.1 phosphatase PAP2 family protein [Anaerovoracaceae bacterium]
MNRFERIIPRYSWIPLMICFFVNGLVYWITQALMENSYHYDFTTDFDRMVPAVSWWVSIYILSYGFWALCYIKISRESRSACRELVGADLIAKTICAIFFIILPTTNVRPQLGDGFWDVILGTIYAMDAPTNLFPSIHCLVSWLCFAAMRDKQGIPKWMKLCTLIFALAVCASTQFTKQHYIVDVVGGIILAEIALLISKKRNGTHRLIQKG